MNTPEMNAKIAMICAWSGIVFIVALGVGWIAVGGYLPPHPPSFNADQIASIYRESTTRMRLGMAILIAGAVFYLPWAAALGQQLQRIEGGYALLSRIQNMSGSLTVYMFALPATVWVTTAFRPERPPELTLLFNDLGWIMFAGMFSPFWFTPVVLTIAILIDKNREPIFPRWAAYFNAFVAISMPLGALLFFFKEGPFSWNGIIAFWEPAVVAGIWFPVMFVLLKKAIARQLEEETGKA